MEFKSYLEEFKILRGIYAILVVLLGAYLSDHLNLLVLLKILAIFFAWEYTSLLNNWYDRKIDEKLGKKRKCLKRLKKKGYWIMIIFFFLASFFCSLPFFPLGTSLILVSLFLGTIYSAPPLRLRKYIFSSCFIGAGTVIALALGMLPFKHSTFLLPIFLITFLSVSVGTVIRDIESYEADKKLGIKTIFTIFGKKNGKKISAVLLFLSFIFPIPFFSQLYYILILIGIVATWLFCRTENYKIVMLLVMIVFLSCALYLKQNIYS